MKSKGYWKRVLAHILCVCMIVLTVCGTNVSTVQATQSTSESSVENVMESSTEIVMEDSDEDSQEIQEVDNEEEDTSKDEENADVNATQEKRSEAEEAETQETENAIVLLAEEAATIYFLNSKGWGEVGAYIYGDKGELLGGWGSTVAESADELGSNWLKVSVSTAPPYSIIFFNKANESERAELYLESEEHIYVTTEAKAYTSQADAEATVKGDETPETPSEPEESEKPEFATYIYFLNSQKWETVGAYIYGDKGELLGGWGTTIAEQANELGEDWVKVGVTDVPPFNIIFFNKDVDAERAELYIPEEENIYVTVTANSYKTQEEAEKAVNDTDTIIYFLNNNGMEKVYAHAYANDVAIGGSSWPGFEAAKATDMGENWWQVSIPQNAATAPFTVIFNDNGADQIAGIEIINYKDNYVTGNAELFTTQREAEAAVGIVSETVVYFLNNKEWANLGAYVYGVGEALGPWPGVVPDEAPELGEKWFKVTVPAKPTFSIIFFNKDKDGERTELQIPNERQVYVTGSKAVYGSKTEAELAEGLGDPSLMTELFFYNSRGWGDINAYVFVEEGDEAYTVGAGWPGKAAEKATEIGENWWKVMVPVTASEETPFKVIFNDGMNQTEDIEITDKVKVYVAVTGEVFATPEDAEEAAANDAYDDGCEDGPNTDLANYKVTYNGAGAALPYAAYEAEAADTNAEVLEKATAYRESVQSEASGRQAVKLNDTGDYVEFMLAKPANTMVLRYNMPDSADGAGINASLSMYIDDEEAADLELTSKYAWVYGGYPYNNNPSNGQPHRYFDEMRTVFGETLPAGTTIRLQKDTGDTADNYIIDFIECELVGDPIEQPENSLSVTDFGAVANDGEDDYAAFVECIAAAEEENKDVWIPAGIFNLEEEKALEVNAVTIRGAGMWHTNLEGAGVSFHYKATCKFYDFSMTGVSAVRDDSGDLAGFEGVGRATNVTIQNIWMEHIKVGVWSANTENLVIQGCRIRNTYADGINLCSGTNNATVRNNSVRNTGDDCIAIWPWLADCSGNAITHNTIQVPTLANGVAIYGGSGNVADNNYVRDIINNGAGICVGSEFETKQGFAGTITVKDNLLERCGSKQTDENYPIGAIWLWAAYNGPMNANYDVFNNNMKDCSQEGILLECGNVLTGVNLQNNEIDGATDGIYIYGKEKGSGKVENLKAKNLTGVLIHSDNPNFVLAEENGNTSDKGNAGDSNVNTGSNNGSDKSDSSTNDDNSSDANDTTLVTVPSTEIKTQQVPLAEQIVESAEIPYANVTFETKEAVLKLELLTKYHGRNLYLMAHVGNGIGYTISNEELGKAKDDLVLGSSMEMIAGFAADFDTFHIQPVQEKQLSYEIGLHMNVGAEFAVKTAYLFSKNLATGTYQLSKAMTVSEIGNVALMTNEITDVMILIAR